MHKSVKFTVAAAVAAGMLATAGGAGAIQSPRDSASGQATGVFDSGSVRGIVIARRLEGKRAARVVVALRGLPEDASLVADTQPCSTLPGRDDVVLGIIMANTEGDFHFRATRARLQKRVGQTRTLRIYDRSKSGSASQVACTRAVVSKR